MQFMPTCRISPCASSREKRGCSGGGGGASASAATPQWCRPRSAAVSAVGVSRRSGRVDRPAGGVGVGRVAGRVGIGRVGVGRVGVGVGFGGVGVGRVGVGRVVGRSASPVGVGRRPPASASAGRPHRRVGHVGASAMSAMSAASAASAMSAASASAAAASGGPASAMLCQPRRRRPC